MPAPVVDQFGSSQSSNGTTTTISVTSAANRVVLVFCTIGGTSLSLTPTLSISGAGLTWTSIGAASGLGLGFGITHRAWWAYTASAISAQTVTITSSQSIDDAATIFVTYSGAYAAAPLDPHANAISTAFNPAVNQLLLSSSKANDVAVIGAGSNSSPGHPTGVASGTVEITLVTNGGGSRFATTKIANRSFTTAQSNAVIGWTSTRTPLGLVGVMLTADAAVSPTSAAVTQTAVTINTG